jgi:hypothetical protein
MDELLKYFASKKLFSNARPLDESNEGFSVLVSIVGFGA